MKYAIVGTQTTIDEAETTLKLVREWAARHGKEVLLADARAVFGRDHLESAAQHALRAQSAETMVARSISMETLRYLAGERQVADAIRVAGIRRGTHRVAIAVFGDASADALLARLGWARDDSVLGSSGKNLADIGVSQTQRETVPPDRTIDLALERVALVDVTK